ncbi:ATP-binding protein [Paenibacillus barengoltzii]|uniref:ATP-binding protein n=1 Tax=Paenibacillus barengoltzii TaxID=343517 RepID=UPI003A4DF78F
MHNTDESFFLKFKPIEITIILDNLISNSRKANARLITVQLYIESNNLYIIYKDDGKGLDKNIVSTEVIFEKGFTTTMGSGLGLFHVKQILNEMNSSIKVNSDIEKGFELVIEVKR